MNKLEFHKAIVDKLIDKIADGCSVEYDGKTLPDTWTIKIYFGNGFFFETFDRAYDAKGLFNMNPDYNEVDVENAVHAIIIESGRQFLHYFWGYNC